MVDVSDFTQKARELLVGRRLAFMNESGPQALINVFAAALSEAYRKGVEDERERAWKQGYAAGFKSSGEGYNGEFPFADRNVVPEHDPGWLKDRDRALAATQPPAEATKHTNTET